MECVLNYINVEILNPTKNSQTIEEYCIVFKFLSKRSFNLFNEIIIM